MSTNTHTHTANPPRKLLWLNGGLLVALAAATIVGHAVAQPGDTANLRNRGDYTMISGRFQGGTTSAVYILDAANQQVMALTWDRNGRRFDLLGLRSLSDDARLQRAPR
ncbi:MAG: hypothetical protein KF768_09175 [Phycisphaeraceae bacterium]|nr:hypothetical protein [Phycisphaeraceae bacterium]